MNEVITVSSCGELRPAAGFSVSLFEDFGKWLDVSPRTAEAYARALRRFAAWLAAHGVREPGRAEVLAFRESLKAEGRKPATVTAYMVAVRRFFAWTASAGLWPDAAKGIKGQKVGREPKKDAFTAAGVRDVLAAARSAGSREFALCSLLFTAGLRCCEAQRANVEDLRTVAGVDVLFVQGKGKEDKAEFVRLAPEAVRALRAYLAERGARDGEPLFTSRSNNSAGGRLSVRSISGLVKGLYRAAGYCSSRLTAHSARHTAVTLALKAGKTLQAVQQFARHASIATTLIYAHNLDKLANDCGLCVSGLIFPAAA